MKVFLSHSQQDKAVYTNFCLTLHSSGVERWDPERMVVGQSLATQLREAIQICDACVFLATKRSVASKWCMAELGAFWGAGKQVLIFLADPDLRKTELPAQFQEDLWTQDAEKVLATLQSIRPFSLPARSEFTPNDMKLLASARDPHYPSQTAAYAFGREPKKWDDRLCMRYIRFAEMGLLQRCGDTEIQLSEKGRNFVETHAT